MSTEQFRNNEQRGNDNSVHEQQINLIDIFRLIMHNWYWFVLSVLLCVGAAFIYLKSSPKVYSRKASVLIRDDSKGGGSLTESSAFADLSLFGGKRNVDNEVLVFQSRHLIEEVSRRLHLDMSYRVQQGLREHELYTGSPVVASLPEIAESQSATITVTPVDSTKVILSDLALSAGGEIIQFEETIEVPLGDTVSTPIGLIVVTPSLYYTENYYGIPISVFKSNMEKTIESYRNRLRVSLANKMATIIDLTLEDVSTARAEDILNMIISVYNEDAINDKNQITVNHMVKRMQTLLLFNS